jgi:GTP:adenosylcobinamide-phosphate guanylyltransferase/aminoglycoside phosphotransferase
MNINYFIVQAGGKGARLKHLTRNKPKCLVPVDNLPIVFHLFRQFPQKKFIIIGDYKQGVLEKYLDAFAEVQYVTVHASGTGTCSGIRQAMDMIPPASPFALIWSDIMLPPGFMMDNLEEADYIGISCGFECRWSFVDGALVEKPSRRDGVAGFFIFRNAEILKAVPGEGEFVRFLAEQNSAFARLDLEGAAEMGTLRDIADAGAAEKYRCRPFNRMEVKDAIFIKVPVDDQGEKLAVRERAWYREAGKYGFTKIPQIRSFDPLAMKRVDGQNIYRAALDDTQKKRVIDTLIGSLEELHQLKKTGSDVFSIMEAYYRKTLARIEKVRNLIPFADKQEIRINGKDCRNIYFFLDEFRELVKKHLYAPSFSFIHGDCTFSNTMVDDQLQVTFLDPRGYFGFTEIYGDPAYDWAKVFYSINGNYDQFNNRKFSLDIRSNEVVLEIASSGWERFSGYFLSKLPPPASAIKIKLIHAVIWLSLTTYAWEDYDSICGAFYKGLLVFDDFFKEYAS